MRVRYLGCGVLAIAVVCAAVAAAAAEAIQAPGRVSQVTVYRGQALVSRVISVKPPAGLSEVLVGDLPERVVPESLFATGAEGVEVRAVRYRSRSVSEEPRPEVRQLDADIERVQREIQRNKTLQAVAAQADQYLGRLGGFVAPTAQTELTKGVLNADTLKKLTEFILEQQSAQAEKALDLQLKERDLTRELELLNRKRAELAAGSSRTVREAVLFVDAAQPAAADITLTYLVTNAGWEPSYNLRARNASDAVQLEYNAAIFQMSGEDWKDVEVTLSTASPALMAEGPELAPFWVSLAEAPPPGAAMDKAQVAEKYDELRSRLGVQVRQQQSAVTQAANAATNWSMNVDANYLQAMEAFADLDAIRASRAAPGPAVEAMSVTYRLPGRSSLESRSDRQLVRIADLELKGEFYYVATPVLSGFVYRQAEIANESELAMLEGPATVYRDGGFVGKSDLPMVAQGQKFAIGFGLEPQLRASREMLTKNEDTMGANREINFKYRLALENYMDAPVSVRLYDRLPYAAGGAEIRVTPGEMTDELSKDPLYLETERTKGILRWDIEVPARASGTAARKVEYAYKMEFDRRLHVTTPLGAQGAAAGRAGDLKAMGFVQEEVLREEFQSLNRGRKKAR